MSKDQNSAKESLDKSGTKVMRYYKYKGDTRNKVQMKLEEHSGPGSICAGSRRRVLTQIVNCPFFPHILPDQFLLNFVFYS